MPLVEEIDPSRPRPSRGSDLSTQRKGLEDTSFDTPLNAGEAELPPELEEWRKANPEAFAELIAATMAAKAAGEDPEAAVRRLEQVLAHQQASQVAQEGISLPGQKGKVGLDGTVMPNVTGIDITPTPSFVVKTTRLDGAGAGPAKIFLNLCSHDALAEPHLKKKLDEEGNEVEGWNIPLGVGPPRVCTDHKGDSAVVYDCVVNSKVGRPVGAERGATSDRKY